MTTLLIYLANSEDCMCGKVVVVIEALGMGGG